MKNGTVFLVGAGPGDPGLLTLAGKAALESCDVVVYDRLVDPRLLNFAPVAAERIYVGKSADRHTMKQDEINRTLSDHALLGKSVVRLKGGDPFVFGRGGEEAEHLRALGIPFVIVPGITSAIAAPAYAGIPVTHRDAASSFAVITGHERGDRPESTTRTAGAAEQRRDWSRIANAADTLVFLMGVESLDEIARNLIENGRPAETPVATIQWGTWNRQRVATADLASIASVVRAARITAPAVTVVGEVVKWRESLQWFDQRPLFGRRIAVTRARGQASELTRRLEADGAEVFEVPAIAVELPDDGGVAVRAAISRLGEFDWVIVTSANGVAALRDGLATAGLDARALGRAQVAAIGKSTADALAVLGIRADFVPPEFDAESMLANFPETELTGKRILLFRAQEARALLPSAWAAAGAIVEDVAAYRTVTGFSDAESAHFAELLPDIDAITFTASSTVRNLHDALGAETELPEGIVLAAIGPVTAETCQELFRAPDVTAETHTLDGLVLALRAYFAREDIQKTNATAI